MFFPTPISETEQAEDAQYYRHVLHVMIELGAEIAKQLHNEITRGAPQHRPPHLIEDFERVTRGTRRAILLAQRIAEARRATPKPPAPPGNPRRAEPERASQNQPTPSDTVHPDRLDRLEFPDDITRRPIPEIIADIEADLTPTPGPANHLTNPPALCTSAPQRHPPPNLPRPQSPQPPPPGPHKPPAPA